LCYTREMNADRRFWQVWALTLHRWGLGDWISSLLEAAGPLTLLGAQAIYVTQPLLRTFTTDENLSALARLLEEPDQTQSFALFLREGTSRESA
jgi:hypothetical protein